MKRNYYCRNHTPLHEAVFPIWQAEGSINRVLSFYHRALLACMDHVHPTKFAKIVEDCKRRDAEDVAEEQARKQKAGSA
jgi:hypothetical protein